MKLVAEAAFNPLRELEREGDTSRRHTLGAAVEFYLKHRMPGRLSRWSSTMHGGSSSSPTGYDRHLKVMQLGYDVLRHTFFSMHVAAFKSVGEAALNGGNTEAVLKKHCLNLATYTEGGKFWGILPEAPAPKITPITGSIRKATASRKTA